MKIKVTKFWQVCKLHWNLTFKIVEAQVPIEFPITPRKIRSKAFISPDKIQNTLKMNLQVCQFLQFTNFRRKHILKLIPPQVPKIQTHLLR
jgi:hypothetical protein